jgi:hypothetical protein
MSNLVATPLGAGWAQMVTKHDKWNADLRAPSPESPGIITRETFRELMAIHGKLFQVTLLLLCDAVSFGSNAVNPATLRFLRKLGSYLEWEQARAHDISPRRLERDIRALKATENIITPSANGFIAWLEVIKGWTVDDIHERAFGNVITPLSMENISTKDSAPTSPSSMLSPSLTPEVSTSRVHLPPLYCRLAEEIQEFIDFTDRQNLRKGLLEAASALGTGFEKSKVLKGANLYRRYYEVSPLFSSQDLHGTDSLSDTESEYDSEDEVDEEFEF